MKKKGIRSFGNGDGSTSTLNQHQSTDHGAAAITSSTTQIPHPTTLEEMILRLELEEEVDARKAKLNEYSQIRTAGRRMSCVNNSDILKSAKNALNQYPRFSLDGKEAMYRSSFRNSDHQTIYMLGGRKSVYCDRGLRDRPSRSNPD